MDEFLLQLWGYVAILICLAGFGGYPRAFSLASVWTVMFYLAICCSCFFFIFAAGFYFCEIFTNGHKASLRHLWIVLKWSYADKTYTCWFRNLYIWSKLCHNVKFPTSLLQKSKAFTTCLRRPFYDQVSTLQQQRRVLEVVFLYPCKEYGLWILSGSLIRNSGDIALFSGGKFDRVEI